MRPAPLVLVLASQLPVILDKEAGEGVLLRIGRIQLNEWLNERLEHSYAQHGRLAPATLEQLDWPAVPGYEETPQGTVC